MCLSLTLESNIGRIRRVLIDDLNCCQWHNVTLIFRTKVMPKNWRYLRKLMFTTSDECTDVPLVVLGHSVVVVGQ
jgi:hypothetical protein